MDEPNISYQFYNRTEAAWDAMYEAILAAKKSIYWEVYIFVDDVIGLKFIEALAEKARAGVEVKLILDAYGSSKLSDATEVYCRKVGIDVQKYNRMYPEIRLGRWLNRVLHRNHRKLLIIDEEIVFLGGVNVKAEFRSWHDMYIKLNGPVSRQLLRGFAKSYISSGGKKKNVRHLIKTNQIIPLWREKIKYILHSPTAARIPRSQRFYLKALAMAKESINLLTPYYVPDRHFIQALALARKRGVKVNIFLPLRPDHQFMELLAKTYYELTLKTGANIYLLPTMNHGKALSIDNRLGVVGSINITPRSFHSQEESAVSFTDEQMVTDLNILFNDLKLNVEPLKLESLLRKNWFAKFKEWVIKQFENFV